MIDRTEIIRLAGELGLQPRVVEKDYVLGWVLAGIARDEELSRAWLFKGGTCLKKCFFETYRFSEDLDFTVIEPAQLDRDFLLSRFKAIAVWLYDTTGIELPAELLRFDVYDLKTGGRAGEGRIAYRGPIAPRGGDLPRIKLDLTADEHVVLPSVIRPVSHPYGDAPADGMTARCYAFEELFGEKVRALAQRARPRDLYDVVNLFRHGDFRNAAAVIRDIVTQKCRFKHIPFPTFDSLAPAQPELIGEWGNMLGHQLPSLPPVDLFWTELPEFFRWLNGAVVQPLLPSIPVEISATVLRGPAGGIRIPGRSTPFIEVIRFAASNHLLVELDYRDEQGHRRTRPIEPYSLRRTQEGNILLCAVNAERQQPRSYRIERIQGATIMSRGFTPRFVIELTPSGPLVAPDTSRASGNPWHQPPAQRQRAGTRWPKTVYLYRCPVCGKRFERSSMDPTLRAHKAPAGYACSGRRGIYEG
ncbi:MAG: WYL domain-containing protein [Proteobacteria bacterium]|nr:WYL domain-containing protein [Pseudomonadota bacterium]